MIDLKKLRPINFNLNSEIKTKESIKFVKINHGFKKINKCPICQSKKKKDFFFGQKLLVMSKIFGHFDSLISMI